MKKAALILAVLAITIIGIVVIAQEPVTELKIEQRCRNDISKGELIPLTMGWEYKPDRPTTITMPDVPITDEQKEKLYNGEPIATLLPGPGEKKIGWLRFFTPFDPVTAYWVITDSPNFGKQDPEFPSTGSIMRKRHTYMPYCFENQICSADGMLWNLQYLVMPIVKPRKVCTALCRNRDNFPWESAWWSSDKFHCEDKFSDELKPELAEAVQITQNRGAWHVSPLPPEFRRKPEDLNRAQVIYVVDTSPGGNLGDMQSLVNAANEKALPRLAKNVVFVGSRWDWFMNKYHTPANVRQYKSEQDQYREIWAPKFADAGK